jgi:glycosyltransferase involved in cell wall biosynthesis
LPDCDYDIILPAQRQVGGSDMDNRKIFCLLAPSLGDFHFKKDVCLIPYIMQKYCGYKALFVTYLVDNEPPVFPSKTLYTEEIDFDFIAPSFTYTSSDRETVYSENADKCAKDLANYIVKNAEKIDVLFIFGFYHIYFEAIEIYKKKNPNGIVYLKLDANRNWINNTVLNCDFCNFLKNCDLITTESLTEYVNLKWPVPVHYIPNGFFDFDNSNEEQPETIFPYENKENIIYHAGRLGSYPKATETLLEAFLIAADKIPSWKLVLSGAMEDSFKLYIDRYIAENPNLKDRLLLTGYVQNYKEMQNWYKKSKIFAIMSRTEGFALVIPEAKAYGCYIIASDIDSNRDTVSLPELRGKTPDTNYKKENKHVAYGTLFEVDNSAEMAQCLIEVCNNENLLKETCLLTQQDAIQNFNWIKLCKRINNLIELTRLTRSADQ